MELNPAWPLPTKNMKVTRCRTESLIVLRCSNLARKIEFQGGICCLFRQRKRESVVHLTNQSAVSYVSKMTIV